MAASPPGEHAARDRRHERRSVEDCARAAEIRLTREEWYEIYLAAGNNLP